MQQELRDAFRLYDKEGTQSDGVAWRGPQGRLASGLMAGRPGLPPA